MTLKTQTSLTTQVYQIYIKASPQAIWDAITQPEWTEKYMYESSTRLVGAEPSEGSRAS